MLSLLGGLGRVLLVPFEPSVSQNVSQNINLCSITCNYTKLYSQSSGSHAGIHTNCFAAVLVFFTSTKGARGLRGYLPYVCYISSVIHGVVDV